MACSYMFEECCIYTVTTIIVNKIFRVSTVDICLKKSLVASIKIHF